MLWCIQAVYSSSVPEEISSLLKFKMSAKMQRTRFIFVWPEFPSFGPAPQFEEYDKNESPTVITNQLQSFWMLAGGLAHSFERFLRQKHLRNSVFRSQITREFLITENAPHIFQAFNCVTKSCTCLRGILDECDRRGRVLRYYCLLLNSHYKKFWVDLTYEI